MILRVRFHADPDDPRPIKWPALYPYWVTGFAGDESYSIVVSYADSLDYIKENWPEASDIEFEERQSITFSDRFQKPDWYEEVEK